MKKIIAILFLFTFLLPTAASAAWYNPGSWFSNWTFLRKQETKTEVLEKRIQELEKKLQNESNVLSVSSSIKLNDKAKGLSDKKTETSTIKIQPFIIKDKKISDSATAAKKAKAVLDAKKADDEAQQAAVLQVQHEATLQSQQQAQQKANQDALDAAAAQRVIQAEQAQQAAALQVQQEHAALQAQIAQKQALLAQMKTECGDPKNALLQQILDIKAKYFADVAEFRSTYEGEVPESFVAAKTTQLLNEANTKIQILSNQIDQIKFTCSIKFGN